MKQPKKTVTANDLGLRLGKKIAEYRKKRGMTQASLAEVVSVDNETISRFERGTALPSLVRLLKITEALDIGIGDLLVEASPRPQDGERLFGGILQNLSTADRELLGQIAELMGKRP